MYDTEDTIAAVASAPEGALRGIVRISGPRTLEVLCRTLERDGSAAPPAGDTPAAQLTASRHAGCVEAEIHLGLAARAALPCRILFWPDRRSYTRQPAAEIHTLGSPPLLQALLRRLEACGARRARPGEFTMRAFLAGRMDLTQAEAVLGVIDAENDSELETALAQLAGGLAQPLQNLRETLLELLAHLEAGLDFVDEDIEFISRDELAGQLGRIQAELRRLIEQVRSRSHSGGALRVVFVGPPNAGKSSLINALAGRDAAIVSPVPGTTRDYVSSPRRLGKLDCTLIDTAGIESARTAIEQAAQTATAQQHQTAHLVVLCLDTPRFTPTDGDVKNDGPAERELLVNQYWQALGERTVAHRLLVVTKADLSGSLATWPEDWLVTSAETGRGLAELERRIATVLDQAAHFERSLVISSTAERCRASLHSADAALGEALAAAQASAGEELVAAEMRGALEALGEVAGAVYTDDVLDRIFSRFCIGK